jgi:hypothetical protein
MKAFAAPHVAAAAAVVLASGMDLDVRIAGLRTLGSVSRFIPAVAEYIFIVKHFQTDPYFGATADAVMRAFERAGLFQRSRQEYDVYGNPGSADLDVLRLWMRHARRRGRR